MMAKIGGMLLFAVFAILLFLLCMILRYVYKMINCSRMCSRDQKQRIEHCSELPKTLDEENQPMDNELEQSREDEKAILNKREYKDHHGNKDSSTSNGGANHGNSEFKVDNVVVQQISQERMTPNSNSSAKKTKSNAVAPYQMNDLYEVGRESGMTHMTHGGPLEGAQEVDQNRTESALLMPPIGKDVLSGVTSGADDGVLDNRNSSAGTTNEHVNETRGRHALAVSD